MAKPVIATLRLRAPWWFPMFWFALRIWLFAGLPIDPERTVRWVADRYTMEIS